MDTKLCKEIISLKNAKKLYELAREGKTVGDIDDLRFGISARG